MSIRFKFRSSVSFDSIDIDGRPSISVRDLRSKIVEQKNLKICQDFNLVISDADTGQEYEDENFLVTSGSSVIIKRVPAERLAPSVLPHVAVVGNMGVKHTDPICSNKSSLRRNDDVENFDDFGIDFYPALGESLFESDHDVDKMNYNTTGTAEKAIPRCSETSIVRCQNLEPSDLSEAVQKGAIQSNLQMDTLQAEMKPEMEEQKKLDYMVDPYSPTMPKSDLPSELRCSLCNTIFKDAVMIPCCQHSFCEKCIRLVLIEKARCPKCSSSRCRVEDLLPNLSLRQAIEHFLESQMLASGSDNILPKYVPDGESGIRMKDVSCAISIRQREPALPHSPSATGKGSNQVMAESTYEPATRKKVPAPRIFHLDVAANPTMKKTGPFANVAGETYGTGSFAAGNRYRKGDRTCYMCGSPDHFIRDCPTTTGQYPMLHTGDAMYPGGMPAYGPPYWQGSAFPQVRPFGNVYATPGMMPFSPTMVPVAPYMPSMYGGLSVPCGFMGPGGLVPPMAARAERPVSQAEFMELQDSEQRHKLLSEHQKREKLSDGYPDEGYHYPQLSHDCKPHLDREDSASYSEISDTQWVRKKHTHYKHLDEDPHFADRRPEMCSRSSTSGKDRRAYHRDVSSSGIQELSGSSNQHSKERYIHRPRSFKRYSDKRLVNDVDSNKRIHRHSEKGAGTDKNRFESDLKRHSHRHHTHLESASEHSLSGDRKRQRKEKASSHSSKQSRHKVRSRDEALSHDRWEMIDGLDDDNLDDYYHHRKHKRRH